MRGLINTMCGWGHGPYFLSTSVFHNALFNDGLVWVYNIAMDSDTRRTAEEPGRAPKFLGPCSSKQS